MPSLFTSIFSCFPSVWGRIGLIAVAAIAGYFVLTFFATRFVIHLHEADAKRTKKTDRRLVTLARSIRGSSAGIVIVIAGIMILHELQIDTSALITSAGVMGFAISFGAQTLIKDIIAGLFIFLEDQYSEGDDVILEGISGKVADLSLRKTILVDKEKRTHHIPNGTIKIVTVTKQRTS